MMKLIFVEAQSEALRTTLKGRVLAGSELLITETSRAVHRLAAGMKSAEQRYLFDKAASTLSRTTLLPLDRTTLDLAGRFREPSLRWLDAIHVATALIAGDDLEAFVTYDRRQGRAASQAGFEVLAPGV